jgi:hypothetical protein
MFIEKENIESKLVKARSEALDSKATDNGRSVVTSRVARSTSGLRSVMSPAGMSQRNMRSVR